MPKTILVVDDEPSILKLVTATLEPKGYIVITAYNGMERIVHRKGQAARPHPPRHHDAEDGRQRGAASDSLKDPKTKDIPVIHLSAVGDFEQQLEAFDEGAIDYITKPFAPQDLRDHVADMLDPAKREQMKRERAKKSGKVRTIVDIMHRSDTK